MKSFNRFLRATLILLLFAATPSVWGQNAKKARQVLDKTAAVVGRKSGAQAKFHISNSKIGASSGTIAIKGNRFYASTPQTLVWFDGKTQWSYSGKNNEVYVKTPTKAQQLSMNPYTFINMYKQGYTLGLTEKGRSYQVHMKAQNAKNSVQEIYILVNKKSYVPSQVRMRQGQNWSTITVSNFQAKNLPNSMFTFNRKDFPKAEIIDLR